MLFFFRKLTCLTVCQRRDTSGFFLRPLYPVGSPFTISLEEDRSQILSFWFAFRLWSR
jgi:hypothetical protein